VQPNFAVRAGTLADVEIIVAHRRAMFFDGGFHDQRALDEMSAAFGPWLRRKMQAGEYLAWFAVSDDNHIAAGAGLWLMDWPPHMIGPGRYRGNIVNVYTDPRFRRMGLAMRLMETVLDWCRNNRVRAVILHASDEGRPLYDKLGFTATNEMRIVLDDPADGQ